MRTDVLTTVLTTPATAMQESVWWVHQRARNKSIYNLTWRHACDRPVDFDALRIAWQAMVDRHEALRTSVTRAGSTIELNVLPHVAAELDRVEVDDPGTVEAGTLLRLIAEEVQQRTMALDRSTLARLTLVRVGGEYELLLTVHHVMLDGWAVQLLLGELSSAYAAALDGREPSFAEDPAPFHVYADELRAARAEGRWQPTLGHWSETLDGVAMATLVPDRPVQGVVGAPGTTVRYRFSDAASAGIGALSKTAFATPFATVLGALDIVLARGGAGADLAVGVVVANRMSVRDQALVGYTANLCIARATIADGDSIAEVVARSRDGMWTMLAHQGVPYPAVFDALSPATQARLMDAPPVPVMLSYLGPIGNDLRLGDVGLTRLRTPNRVSRADFAMSFWDAEGGHLAEFEFNTARYDRDTVLGLMRDLDAVLAAGGTDPARMVGSLDVRTRAMTRSAGTAPPIQPGEPTRLPESPAWERVSAAWAELLDSPPAGPDVDFFAAGGHSLGVVRLAAALEAGTGIEIEVADWLVAPTPRRMVAQLTGEGRDPGTSADTTVVGLRDGTGPHLHLVHGAGGGPHDYRDLLAALPGHWRVTLSQETEASQETDASQETGALTTVAAMAQRYQADLAAAQLRPDVLGGWSLGGQIAYEMAFGYEEPRPALVLLDSTPPVTHEAAPDVEEERFATFAATVCRSLGVEPGCSLPRTAGNVELRTEAFAAYLASAGEQVPATVLADRWQTYRRHVRAGLGHVRSDRIDAATLIVGAELLDIQLDQWAARVGPAPRLLRVQADHFGLLHAGVAVQIAAAIEEVGRGVTADVIRRNW